MPEPKSRPLKRKRLCARRTAVDIANLLELMDRDFVANREAIENEGALEQSEVNFVRRYSVIEVAKKHGISPATYYRWQAQRRNIQREIYAKELSNETKIESALETLCDGANVTPLAFAESLFQLITWMRWPTEREFYAAAMVNCTASYLLQKHPSSSIEALSPEEISLLYKYANLNVIVKLSSPEAILNPSFEIVSNGLSRYDDRRFYANVINYLLSEPINYKRQLHRPSLGNLSLLVSQNTFGSDWSVSERTFKKRWRHRAASCPFLYVEHYHSQFDASLNPLDDDFSFEVDQFFEDRAVVKKFLGQVKWVIMELKRTLDSRAARHVSFPVMPNALEPVPVVNPPVGRQVRAKIGDLF